MIILNRKNNYDNCSRLCLWLCLWLCFWLCLCSCSCSYTSTVRSQWYRKFELWMARALTSTTARNFGETLCWCIYYHINVHLLEPSSIHINILNIYIQALLPPWFCELSLQSAGSPTNIRNTKLLKFVLDDICPLPYNKMRNDKTNITN